jgi:putative molybdopterin biosynthesis protein
MIGDREPLAHGSTLPRYAPAARASSLPMAPSKAPAPLLTTGEVAALLSVHPKHVYRLMRQGLPARRVGSAWRFEREEVLAWAQRSQPSAPAPAVGSATPVPSLVAANGDLAVEILLRMVDEQGTSLGLLKTDRGGALERLRDGRVLLAGCHGAAFPAFAGGVRLARIQLVTREVGLCARGVVPPLRELANLRLAARPPTAGVVVHLERALAEAKVPASRVLSRAQRHGSHADVVAAVVRGDADVGLTTHAWSQRLGLSFHALGREDYGLLVRAAHLSEPAVVRVCEVAQSAEYREALAELPGYDATAAGVIRYDIEPAS